MQLKIIIIMSSLARPENVIIAPRRVRGDRDSALDCFLSPASTESVTLCLMLDAAAVGISISHLFDMAE